MNTLLYQGVLGSYSSVATKYFGDLLWITEYTWYESFGDVWNNISPTAYAVIPIENSYAGSIHENMYLCQEYWYTVHAQYSLEINHCLIWLDLHTEITDVYSHRQALAQTYTYCKDKNIVQHKHMDTADAVRLIKEMEDPAQWAIASSYAAELYNVPILDHNIQDQKWNITKFLLVWPWDIDTSLLAKRNEKQFYFSSEKSVHEYW